MSAAAMIRTCVVHGVVLLLAGRALAQTDATNPPAPPPAAVVSASQSPPKSPPLAPDGFFQEPLFLSNSIDFMIDKVGDGGEPKSGFYPEFSNMMTGSGWVSVGPGYRQFLFDRKLLIDGSAAVSWRLYKMMQARVELLANDRVTVGTQVMWRDDTQVNYFGIGSDAFDSEQSHYRMKATNLVGYASARPTDSLTFDGTLGWRGDDTPRRTAMWCMRCRARPSSSSAASATCWPIPG